MNYNRRDKQNTHRHDCSEKAAPDPHKVICIVKAQECLFDFPVGTDINYMIQVLSEMARELSKDERMNKSPPVLEIKNDVEDYHLFISYAREDKLVATELADWLSKLRLRVWFDDSDLVCGDSIRAGVEDGIRRSRYGIVLVSPAYLGKDKYWTKLELDALLQKEYAEQRRVIFFVWHNVTEKEIEASDLILAGRKGISTLNKALAAIAIEIAEIIRSEESE